MDNENKEFQGTENEINLTPEEKVQEDISSKIAEAAEEVRDEIDAANGEEIEEVADDSWSDEAYEEAVAEEVKEPAEVTVKKSTFIASIIGAVIAGALALLLCLQIPAWIEARPEGTTVASVNGEKITDLDVRYYIYAQAADYAQKNGVAADNIKNYDWDQEIDGKKLSDTIRENALKDAINEVLTIQKGAEQGITLSDDENYQIDMQIRGLSGTYGEEGFTLRTRTMGVSSPKQYEKMYYKIMTMQKVQQDINTNRANYYPEDETILNDYIQPDKASVKHVLISTEEEFDDEGNPIPVSVEEKQALAQTVLDRANNGDDFDALIAEYNDDPGSTEAGYNFVAGDMVAPFEAAAFALKLDEISGIVETDYGYHIIKRIPGPYELQAYWAEQANIKSNDRKLAKLSVSEIMTDVQLANDELTAQMEAGATN